MHRSVAEPGLRKSFRGQTLLIIMGDVATLFTLLRTRRILIPGSAAPPLIKGDVVSHVDLLILRDRGTEGQSETGNRGNGAPLDFEL